MDLTADHVVELQDGGPPFDRRNLRVLCRWANTARNRREHRHGGTPGALVNVDASPALVGDDDDVKRQREHNRTVTMPLARA